MIAACPKCAARYRIDRERLKPEGVRLRCARCEAVFRVRMPEAAAGVEPAPAALATPPAGTPQTAAQAPSSAPAASEQGSAQPSAPPPAPASGSGAAPLILVAIPDAELAKQCENAVADLGFRAACAVDGVEAMLEIQRQLPEIVVLAASLPRMFGFQICEIVKRNESLRDIRVVLVGSVHHRDRYRRPPGDLYGADEFIEEPDLPDALSDLLRRIGGAAPGPSQEPSAAASELPTPEQPLPRQPAAAPEPALSPPGAPSDDDGLDAEREKAERLARIIVSDIILYNEEKFTAAVEAGNVHQAMSADLDEGRGLFVERIDERVRDECDYLVAELLRVARERGVR